MKITHRTIRVPIQNVGKKFCCWCHGQTDGAKQIIGDASRYRWCHIFAKDLEIEEGMPVRCGECLEGEV